jgi:hypothetical protein
MLSFEEVLYKDIKCRIIWDYENGYYEVLVNDEVLLLNESDITRPTRTVESSSACLSICRS